MLQLGPQPMRPGRCKEQIGAMQGAAFRASDQGLITKDRTRPEIDNRLKNRE